MKCKRLRIGEHNHHPLTRGRTKMEDWKQKIRCGCSDVRFEKPIRYPSGDMKQTGTREASTQERSLSGPVIIIQKSSTC